jgi:hypothetical protein
MPWTQSQSIEENLVNDVKCIDGKIVIDLSMALNSFEHGFRNFCL